MAPHVLHMTATPIPRTLSLTAYGDLDTTALHELPAGRKPVETRIVEEDERAGAYEFIRERLREGRQAYVVCPLVEESEKLQGEGGGGRGRAAGGRRAARLRGRRHPRPDAARRDKAEAMEAFASGATDVLVATTVIEVGIDVPNATVMLIEGAERYGVSQLHQLRGRVGRGEHESHCLLFAEEAGEMARRRLQAVERESDGFKLAEIDLSLRGEGEILGTRQHGLPRFAVAELPEDTPTPDRGPRRGARPAAPPRLPRRPRARPAARGRPPPLRRRRRRPDTTLMTVRVIAGELGGQSWSRRAAGRCGRPPTASARRSSPALGEHGRGRAASSTSTAAPARWRSRRSRAAPPAPRWSTATPGRRSATSSASASATGSSWSALTSRAGSRATARARTPPGFDLVFVDAPYRLADRVGQELDTHLPRLLDEGGRAIVESGAGRPLRIDSLERLRQRRYGAADVSIYGEDELMAERDGTVVCPGSYDPVTNGHLDIITRTAAGLRAGRGRGRQQPDPQGEDALHGRGAPGLHRRGDIADLPNVEVGIFSNLLVEFARETGRQSDRQGPAGDLRLRVRVRDGPAQPQARPRDREHLRDRLAPLQLPFLDRGQGNGDLRRRRLRPRSRRRLRPRWQSAWATGRLFPVRRGVGESLQKGEEITASSPKMPLTRRLTTC